MPPASLDFGTLTHVIHFSVVPNSNGTLDSSANVLTAVNSSNLVFQTHAAGRKVLFCVGGAGSQAGFQGATSAANRPAFIANLVNFMTTRGYDGIDLDWEPLDASDANQFTNFVNSLRTALNALNPKPLLTAAIASPPTPTSLIASLQTQFDQINLMTYDLSGPYPGWVTWFNAPIFDGGYRFASTGGLVPSAAGMVGSLTNAGVVPGRLGIGIAFYGYIWSGGAGTTTGGVSLPRQSWTTAPTVSQLAYNNLIATYFQSNLYHWDDSAQAAYLSIDNTGSSNDKFISYDDERVCQAKVSYARNAHLGGVMIWELAQDHKAGQTDPLLRAVQVALSAPGLTSIQIVGTNIDLSFNSAPLGAYRVQFATGFPAVIWNTLTITNTPGTGGPLHVFDTNFIGKPIRAYRIQTPP